MGDKNHCATLIFHTLLLLSQTTSTQYIVQVWHPYLPKLVILIPCFHLHSILSRSLWTCCHPFFIIAFPKPCPTNHVVPLSILALPCLHCWSLHHLGAIFKSSYILSIWWKCIGNTIDDLTNNFANNNRLFWEFDLERLDHSEGS